MFKAQASLIDVLLLGFVIALVLTMSFYLGFEYVQAYVTREESFYTQAMLSAAMNYVGERYGNFFNKYNTTIAEAIDLYVCKDFISANDITSKLGEIFNKTVKKGYDYIFYFYGEVGGTPKEILVYNKQEKVCAKYIPVKTFNLKFSCNVTNTIGPQLGIWPDWKNLPKECS